MNQPAQAGGYRQMGGGYEDAIAAANAPRGQAPQQQAPMQQMMQQPPQQYAPQPSVQQWSPTQGMQPQGGMPQEGYPVSQIPPQMQPQQQPAQWPPRQQAPWQQQVPAQQAPMTQQPGVDLNSRLSGAGIPPELQGRTVQELVAIHNGLRQVHIQSLAGGQQPQAQLQQQAPQQQPATQQPGAPAWDWRNPGASTEAVVERALDRAITTRLGPMLAPLQQQSAISTITAARAQAVNQVGAQQFAQLEPLINQSLQGIDPQALMNPATWVVAAERAMGQLILQGRMQQQQAPVQQSGPGVYPVQQVPPGHNPMPNLNTFFSETPNQGGPGVPQTGQLTAAQSAAARAMDMTEATYAAWLGGAR
jgi:hypothetical protein